MPVVSSKSEFVRQFDAIRHLPFGASLAIHGDITAGTVLIFFNLCNFIIMPVNIVPQYLASRRAARGLIEKLSQMTVDNAEHDGKDIDIVCPIILYSMM